MNKNDFVTYVAFWFIVILIVASLLSGCTKTTSVTETVADSAKTTISTIIQNKPECKDVGETCNSQIDIVKASCEQELKIQTHDSWKRGLKEGTLGSTIAIVILWFVLKRLFK